MRANDFLTEASIVDKLKGRKNPDPQPRIEPTLDQPITPAVPVKTRKPRTPGKKAFGQMATTLGQQPAQPAPGQQAFSQMAAQVTPKPKPMKGSKRNPNTAVGAKTKKKVGSPEYQAALSQIQQNTQAQQDLTKQQASKGGVSYDYSQVQQPVAAPNPDPTVAPSTIGVNQNRLAKSIALSLDEISDPKLLQYISSLVNKKISQPQ